MTQGNHRTRQTEPKAESLIRKQSLPIFRPEQFTAGNPPPVELRDFIRRKETINPSHTGKPGKGSLPAPKDGK